MFTKRHKSLKWACNQLINRSLQGISYKFNKGIAKPTRIIFCMTLRCNIKCKQCAIWRLPNKEELTTNEWKKAIYELRQFIGPYRVQLAGGEIFVRKDIPEIIRFATKNDVLTGIVSNGTMITPELAKDLVSAGLGYIHISVDGIKPETHDFIRGIPGVHSKAMKSINYLLDASKDSGMSICLATIIMKKNMNELIDLVHWVEDKGLDGIIFNPLGPTIDSDPEWYKKTDLWFDDLVEINAIIDKLSSLKKQGAKIINPPEQFEEMKSYFKKPFVLRKDNCMVGITNLDFTCDGDMHTCYKMASIGNIKEISPREAWNSDLAKSVRQKIKNCDIHCSPGNFVYRRNLLSEIKRFIKYG